MTTIEIGALIRKLRKEKRISQNTLCEGILSVAMLSKVERGTQMLSLRSFDAIMQRLGEKPEQYYEFFIRGERFEVFDLKRKISSALFHKNVAYLEEAISEAERQVEFKDDVNRQFLLTAKASMAMYKETAEGYAEALVLLRDAVKITVPKFTEDTVGSCLLTDCETETINKMSMAYFEMGDTDKCIKLLYALKTAIEKKFGGNMENADKYPLVLYNLSKCLGLAGNYDEALRVSDIGVDACIKTNKGRLLPKMIYNKAFITMSIGDKESCVRLLKQAYYGFDALKMFKEAEHVKDYAQTHLGTVL